LLKQGIEKFNEKPHKGIIFLQEGGFVDGTPENIADLLLNTPGFEKTSIGQLLGDEKPESVKILHAFVDHLNFSNLKFTTALRNFLQVKFFLSYQRKKNNVLFLLKI